MHGGGNRIFGYHWIIIDYLQNAESTTIFEDKDNDLKKNRGKDKDGRKSRIFIPHLYLTPPQGVTPSDSNFVNMFDAGKTRMIGLPYGEKSMTIC